MPIARFAALAAVALLSAAAAVAAPPKQKLYVTNSGGNDVTIVDVETKQVIKTLEVGPEPHGIAASAAGDQVFLSIENMKGAAGELVWLDPVTDTITKRMPVGPKPNQLAVTPDGKIAYVPCEDGHYWVIDTVNAKVVTKIKTGGRPHNTLCSEDGKHMYLSPMGNPKRVFVCETAGHTVVAEIPFSSVTRPIALAKDEKRLYAQVDGLIGFEVADIPNRKMIRRVESDIPDDKRAKASRSHGLAIRPDQKEVWSNDSYHAITAVFDLTGETPRQVAAIATDGPVYWISFTPDGKCGVISERETNQVAIVDAESKKIVAQVPVGKAPKRTLTILGPQKAASGQ